MYSIDGWKELSRLAFAIILFHSCSWMREKVSVTLNALSSVTVRCRTLFRARAEHGGGLATTVLQRNREMVEANRLMSKTSGL